jgi:hypothetical protein
MDVNRLREIHQELSNRLPGETEKHSLTHVLIGIIESVMPFAEQMPGDADAFVRAITEKETAARAAKPKSDPKLPLPQGVVRGTINCNRDHYAFDSPMEQLLYDDSLKWATQTIAAAMAVYNARGRRQPFDSARWQLASNEAHEIAHDIWESAEKECDDDAGIAIVFEKVTGMVFDWCYAHMNR